MTKVTRALSWYEIQSVFATWAAHAKHDEYSLQIWNVLLDDLRSRAESPEESSQI
jgi:hypothetical protein